jgi:hypothetical protein
MGRQASVYPSMSAHRVLLGAPGFFQLHEDQEVVGRGGGDRIYQGAESKGTLRNVL